MRLVAIGLLVILCGCGTVRKMVLRTSSPVFEESSNQLTQEGNWHFFKESAPANLKMVEMIYHQDPNNLDLLSVVIKGYAGYAFAVPETLALEAELSGSDNNFHKKQAVDFYTRALDYGMSYLDKKGISTKEFYNLSEDDLTQTLEKELDEDDLTAVLYTAQAWGSLINLQKDNMTLVSQVPKVKTLFDWVCGKKPSIDHGVCNIFYAQYEASRPKMLGGNPEKAKELYLSAIETFPKHLLIRLGYIQYLLLPGYEQAKYEQQAEFLKTEFEKWENFNRDTLENTSEYRGSKELNLYNAIAKKRFEIIEKYKNEIF
jgi:hypothetical protein